MVVVQCLSEFSVWMCKCLLLLIHLPCSGWFWFKIGRHWKQCEGQRFFIASSVHHYSRLLHAHLLLLVKKPLHSRRHLCSQHTFLWQLPHMWCLPDHICYFLCSVHQLFQWICCPTEYKTCYTWYLYLSVFLMLSRVCFWDWIFSGVF